MTAQNGRAPSSQEAVLEDVLRIWAEKIRLHEPDDVAAAFAPDAVFQGSDPSYAVGRGGVAAYYDKQPRGLAPEHRVREIRSLGERAFVAYVDVDFNHADGHVNRTHLTLVLVQADRWLIQQYHVSEVVERTASTEADSPVVSYGRDLARG